MKATDFMIRQACDAYDLHREEGKRAEWFGMEAAIQAVLDVLPNAQGHVGVREGLTNLYNAASKGFHTSESCGPDNKYWHVSKFQSLQDLQSFDDAWVKVMLFARDK